MLVSQCASSDGVLVVRVVTGDLFVRSIFSNSVMSSF